MAKFFIILLLWVPHPSCLQIDIMLLADMSGSVQGQEQFVKAALYTFANQFDLSEDNVKIGVVTFDSDATLWCPLTADKNKLLAVIGQINNASGGSNMTAGLAEASDQLLHYGRPYYNKLIIIISDGGIWDIPATTGFSDILTRGGIRTCGVLIEDQDTDSQTMETICHGCYERSSYRNLSNELKKLDICF